MHTRQYKTKNASAQEAHEAIRPTYMDLPSTGADSDQVKLYDLIWKRAMASQMSAAELEKTEVDISISKAKDEMFIAEGEVLLFDGFLKSISNLMMKKMKRMNLYSPMKNGGISTYQQIWR